MIMHGLFLKILLDFRMGSSTTLSCQECLPLFLFFSLAGVGCKIPNLHRPTCLDEQKICWKLRFIYGVACGWLLHGVSQYSTVKAMVAGYLGERSYARHSGASHYMVDEVCFERQGARKRSIW